MCIFSQSVRYVSRTNVFTRVTGDRQVLAYEMRLASTSDLAMILPLPTQAARVDQTTFVDLSDYTGFFDDIAECFPELRSRSVGSALAGMRGASLVVHRVGAFDASFVPALADFQRLDARFRLPDTVWGQLPNYRDYGFAVFQLRAGDSRIHPMALSFKTRNPTALFFPTAHVHDGTVHHDAQFDHLLYAQGELPHAGWLRGSLLPREVLDFGKFPIEDRTQGIVDPGTPIARCVLRGTFPNQDTWLAADGAG